MVRESRSCAPTTDAFENKFVRSAQVCTWVAVDVKVSNSKGGWTVKGQNIGKGNGMKRTRWVESAEKE